MRNWQSSIPRELAIDLAQSGWWRERPSEEVVFFQLGTAQLSMDFGDFQQAMQDVLRRPVWMHEFANPEGLLDEWCGVARKDPFAEIAGKPCLGVMA